jgi:hypothetical protein
MMSSIKRGATMRKLGLLAVLGGGVIAGCFGATAEVSAATINTVLTVTATNFGPGTSPYATITGTFDVTYDPALSYASTTGQVTGYSFSSTPTDPGSPPPAFGFSDPASTLEFTYQPGNSFQIRPAGFFSPPSHQYNFALNDAFTAPGLSFFAYVPVDGADPFQSQGSDVTFSFAAPASTPIPGSVVMLLTALAGLGAAAWMRARKAPPKVVSLLTA